MAEALKALVQNLSTSKVCLRKTYFESAISELEQNRALPEATVKGVCRSLTVTFHLYTDARSRRLVRRLFATLAAIAPTETLRHAPNAFAALQAQMRAKDPSLGAMRPSLLAVSCIVAIFESISADLAVSLNDVQPLLTCLCELSTGCAASSKPLFEHSVYKALRRLWTRKPAYLEFTSELLATTEPRTSLLQATSFLCKFLANFAPEKLLKRQEDFVKQFIGSTLALKTAPSNTILKCAGELLLQCVTHNTFSSLLLPAFQKALLRSPETSLATVAACLSHMDLDLSAYADQLLPSLTSQLKNTSEAVADSASAAVVALARQCSDPAVVSSIVLRVHGLLMGAEGKISAPEVRQRLATTLGRLSTNGLVGGEAGSQLFDRVVCEVFPAYIKTETHESTLIHGLAQMENWTKKNKKQLPTALLSFFKDNTFAPKLSSGVRIAYLLGLNAACPRNEAVQQLVPLIGALLELLQRATKQPAQVMLAAEAACAVLLLLRLQPLLAPGEAGKLAPMWAFLTNREKRFLTSHKFLTTAPDTVLQACAVVIEKCVMESPDKFNEQTQSLFFKSLVQLLVHSSVDVRASAKATVRRLLHGLRGVEICLQLLAEIELILQELQENQTSSAANGAAGEGETQAEISSHHLCQALMTITSLQSSQESLTDRFQVALRALMPATHPLLAAHSDTVWPCIIHRLCISDQAGDMIAADLDSLVQRFLSLDKINENAANAVAALAKVSPDLFVASLQDGIVRLLESPEFASATRFEVGVMNTPEGELYDRSILESSVKYEVQTHNIKRESKLYSYKEQMEEMELRKELQSKGKKEQKAKPAAPKLTKKQEEMLAAQRVRESEIRAKLLPLNARLHALSCLLSALSNGPPSALAAHLPNLVPVLEPLLASPLAAPHMAAALASLRAAALPGPALLRLRELTPHLIVRLAAGDELVPADWTQESLEDQSARFVALTAAWQAAGASGGNLAFALLFPALRRLLEAGTASEAVLAVFERQVALSAAAGVEWLAQESLCSVLAGVVASGTGRLAASASACLLELSKTAAAAGADAVEPGLLRELLRRLKAEKDGLRTVSLRALTALSPVAQELMEAQEEEEEDLCEVLVLRLWIAKFDRDELNAKLAAELWTDLSLSLSPALCEQLMADVVHPHEAIRTAAARALSAVIDKYPESLTNTLQALFAKYKEELHVPAPIEDEFGRVIAAAHSADNWEARSGVALALGRLAEKLPEAEVQPLFRFLVPDALNDRHAGVRQEMLSTATTLVELHGKSQLSQLLPLLEDFLTTAPNVPQLDAARQSVIVLTGSLAKHLEKDNPKVKTIFVKLLESLSFPSQVVQQSVAACLPPLMPALRDEAERVVQKLLNLLLEAESYAERRGAAYGLAGVVKGLGILALKQLEITDRLTEAVQNKKNARHREGALFAFELFCVTLGRVYEPYIVHILPHLLLAFGDGNAHVREAANDCAKAVMSKLSAHGVKLVLPSLLKAIEEDSWRTKSGSVELLGAMAFCAPKQLSACLPQIVPRLMEVLADSHLRVQNAGCQALRQIGSVIKNPEIQEIVPVLLEALQEPLVKTTMCLQTLLNTQFVHVIDAPSLALIMPVVQRGFKDRSTETRKMAAQIIGNMYSLTEHKDLQPYLDGMLPGLKLCLLESVPEVRAMAARALGAMVRGMGESDFNEMLMPWLMKTLTSEQSNVDRSGAAQGLAEVIGGLGPSKLESMMPHVMEMTESTQVQPHVRDGYLMMYIYLPAVFGEDFAPFVGPIVPSILRALADETEFVRETALKAGERVVSMFADKAIELLLPELERGMFDENWRIRQSSVQLLGDLLYQISGVSGKGTTEGVDEDDTFGTEASQVSIMSRLGEERRARVLAGLYMARSDGELFVRQAAVHVWKVIVSNTPRTLREIMPVLFSLLLSCLAAEAEEKRKVAASTLGDIVRKLGERVLPEILPILERGLEADDNEQREGVCVGLAEIINNTSKEQMAVHAELLVPPIRRALVDPLPEVRASAALTFDTLYAKVGRRALDEVLPSLLERLDDEEGDAGAALDGLRQVVAVKSAVVLPYLIPKLTTPTVNTRAFSHLASVAGGTLSRHLNTILPALLDAVSGVMGTEAEAEELQHCTQVVLSVADEAGLRAIVEEFTGASLQMRSLDGQIASMLLLEAFVRDGELELADFYPAMLRASLSMFVVSEERLLHAAWDCLNTIVKKWSEAEMLLYVIDLHQSVQMAIREYRPTEVPGFGLPKKGITPFLAVYREGIFNGQLDVKEAAAKGLGEVVSRTSKPALQQAVVKVAGPLIRVMGDRYSQKIKSSILETLGILLEKCPIPMRPFLTQLQTTFIKALNDVTRDVRLRAATALGHLMAINTKPDPVMTELVALAKKDDDDLKDTSLHALRLALVHAGSKVSDDTRRWVAESLRDLVKANDESCRCGAAAALGALCAANPPAEPGLKALLLSPVVTAANTPAWVAQHARLWGLLVALRHAGDFFASPTAFPDFPALRTAVEEGCASDRQPLVILALRCLAYVILHHTRLALSDDVRRSTKIVTNLIQNSSFVDVRHLCARLCSFLAEECSDVGELRLLAAPVLGLLMVGMRDRTGGVRAASEQAVVDFCGLLDREDDTRLQNCLACLEGTTRSALQDIVHRMRKRPLPKDAVPVMDNTELK